MNGPPSFFSSVSAPTQPSDDWVGEYSIKPVIMLEAFLDAPEKVALFAASSPGISLRADLFAEASHPGFQHDPHVILTVECRDDPALTLMEAGVEAMAAELQAVCDRCCTFRIVSHEGAMVDIERPSDIRSAFSGAVASVRAEATKEGSDFLEAVAIELKVDETSSEDAICAAVWVLAALVHSVSKVLYRDR